MLEMILEMMLAEELNFCFYKSRKEGIRLQLKVSFSGFKFWARFFGYNDWPLHQGCPLARHF